MIRFTIRDVLWLTVVVALIVGWWLDHRVQRSLVDAIGDQWSFERNMISEVQFDRTRKAWASRVMGGARKRQPAFGHWLHSSPATPVSAA